MAHLSFGSLPPLPLGSGSAVTELGLTPDSAASIFSFVSPVFFE